jgi:hypothetical protein
MLSLILATFPTEEIDEELIKSKIELKIHPKIMKKKNMTAQGRR